MFVYLTTNKVNGKKYIGMCTRDDSAYIGSGVLLKQAIAKYGRDAFDRTILQRCESFEDLCEAEKYWIDHFDAVRSDEFYNLIEGGWGGNTERLKAYWSSLTSDERKRVRNWKPYFVGGSTAGTNNYWYGKSTSSNVKRVWDNRTEDQRTRISQKVSATKKANGSSAGERNSMYGRSAVREKNLKWYTDGHTSVYVTEGTQPEGFRRGRTHQRKSDAIV